MESSVSNELRAKARLSPNGRFVIPAAIREAMGVKPDDWLYLDLEGGTLRIETHMARIRRIQRELAPYSKPGVLASDELIAERREEARREEEEVRQAMAEERLRNEGKIA